ncbi:fungal-specific transcription factor domain-containing protein [Talaromyces proteolyticus]|uniref:Fungal-specific transcription factor domain-containing protein n=1 Tax=Talaromyces proteolyticus TaxID=1131652 RepID=A0AAD4Q199_9EURO|nr:fungal-specific transcription factor domain-containing protein [Talaromyces proteolyticus]KAH8698489.1 fungal-specific transcription factor domain-containing protein [Talaromyces proteolyticus]
MVNVVSKPARQATACNWCRAHKMKCDTEQPSCRNCHTRGIECITMDLRRPGWAGRRQEPVGRRGKRTPQQQKRSSAKPQEAQVLRQPSPSPSLSLSIPPSPTEKLLAPLVAHDVPLPSIFIAPFIDEDQRPSQSGANNVVPSPISTTSGYNTGDTNLMVIRDSSCSRSQIIGSGGSSMYILVQWLDLFFAKKDFWKPIFPDFQRGLAYSLEVPLGFPTSLPSLPTPSRLDEYLSIFFSRIYPIYPIVDREAIYASVEDLKKKLESQPPALKPKDYPQLACLYALLSASADELETQTTEVGASYLQGAYFLYSHLVAMPYVSSVQALLLLAVVLRNRNKDGASWEILGQAIRMAQSIGLHRQLASTGSSPLVIDGSVTDSTRDGDLHSRIWWTAYVLERAMELDTGRPSAIRDRECDQILPRPVLPLHSSGPCFDYFGALIRLAQIQTSITQLYHNTKERRKTKEILYEMGRLDRALLDLAATFPEEIRPGRDILCPPEEFHFATYFTLQYHQSCIALHRPALTSPTGWLRNRVNHLCRGTPWKVRLRYCLCIGAASARSILKAWNDLLLYSTPSRLITLNPLMLAILVLSIYVTRIPSSLMNYPDLAMVITFAGAAQQEYSKIGQDPEFVQGLEVLKQQLSKHIEITNTQRRPGNMEIQAPSLTSDQQISDQLSTEVDMGLDPGLLDDAWSSLWTDGLNNFHMSDDNHGMVNAYLLGLSDADMAF